jgi:hypothetical protein
VPKELAGQTVTIKVQFDLAVGNGQPAGDSEAMITAETWKRARLGIAANNDARQWSADCPQSAAVDFLEALRIGTTRAPAAAPS